MEQCIVPLNLQDPHHIIQEVNNEQETHQGQGYLPMCGLTFDNSYKIPWRFNAKCPDGSIRKLSYDRPGLMTSVEQIISSQPNIKPQVTGELTESIFW